MTLGIVTGRTLVLVLSTFAFVGRIDRNFLANHINYFGLRPDGAESAFTMDILLHEAHRHPYLERLTLLYLIKIFQGKRFATREGSSWRLLCVLMLMPWLRGYRFEGKDRSLASSETNPNSKEGDDFEGN